MLEAAHIARLGFLAALFLVLPAPAAVAQVAIGANSVAAPWAAAPGPVGSKLYIPPAAQYGRFAELPVFRGSGVGQTDYRISAIAPDSPASSASGGPRKTGVVHTLPVPISASALYWERASGGFAARVRIVADQAQRLRIHVSFADPSPRVEIRVRGSRDATLLGPIMGATAQNREIWLPATSGGEAVLEFFFPTEESIRNGEFQVDQVNYIFGANGQFGRFASTGAAQYTEYDAACYSGSADYASIQSAVAATAKISFIQNRASYECSGTLLNDRGATGIPWFATAYHCISSQSVASTIAFDWHYEATSCGGSVTDSRYSQTYGGAQLLWSNQTYDAAFLRLNSPPGPYAEFAGWNPGPLSIGDQVYGIHHPQGDHTMVSYGTVTALNSDVSSGRAHLVLNTVTFTLGAAEEGSSGSGLFAIENGSLVWKGALFGGPAYDYQINDYGPFDRYYSNVQQYLENTAAGSAADTQPPAAPSGLIATPIGSSQMILAWTASTDNVGVTAYKVYRGGTLIATLGNVTNYSDTELAASTAYSYTVQACDAARNCSAQSSSVSATTQQAGTGNVNLLADCLFDWGETNYASFFSPRGAQSASLGPRYFRYYPQTNAYLAVSFSDNHFFYLGPLSSNNWLDLGAVSTWYATVGCR